jgi:hypothetical protein
LEIHRVFTRDPAPYRFPRPDLYGYAVLRVEEGGRVFWLDPTTRGTPFGVLPGPIRSVEALVLPGPGEAVEVARTPAGDAEERRETRLHVALDRDGGATIDGSYEYRGFEAAALRASVERLDVQARRQAVEQALSHGFRSPALTDLRFDGEDAVEGPLVLRWRARVERWARVEEGRAIVDVLACPECSGRMQLIAFIAEAKVAKRILDQRPALATGGGGRAPSNAA